MSQPIDVITFGPCRFPPAKGQKLVPHTAYPTLAAGSKAAQSLAQGPDELCLLLLITIIILLLIIIITTIIITIISLITLMAIMGLDSGLGSRSG